VRVSIFSTYYWPEESGNAPYVTGLAEHLASLGHVVCVATGYPHYPAWRAQGMSFWTNEEHNGVKVHRRMHYVPRRQSAVSRAAYEGSLALSGLTTILSNWRPDLVVAVMPTLASGFLAAAAATVARCRLGVIFQDLQGLGAKQSGIRGGERVARLVSSSESWVARRADVVGIVAEGFRAHLLAGGVNPSGIHRIRNWSNFTTPTDSIAETRARFGWREDEFICLHAGNLGQKQGLANVVDAAARVPDARVRVVLAGDGNERPHLERRVRDRGVTNVHFIGMQPMGGPCEAMCRAADLLLINQRPAVMDMSLPSKLTTYLPAGRPVLAAVNDASETAREIRASGAGWVVPPGDPHALADVIMSLADRVHELDEAGRAGARYAKDHLSRDVSLREIEAILAA